MNALETNKKSQVTLKTSTKVLSDVTSQNVVGIVEGTDPQLKNEYIIYSAHYDHVGIGTPDETGDTIYNGARDNAVGTTTVLSMAEHLAKHPTKRSALFILFTGEEKGLLGSKYYTNHPIYPLKNTVANLNIDMIGRLDDWHDTANYVYLIGADRLSQELHDISETVNEKPLGFKKGFQPAKK